MADRNLRAASQWQGLWTALITPLRNTVSGEADIHKEDLERLIEAQIASGVRGLVIGGSTGEGSLLSETLYEKLLSLARGIAGNRIPLVAGLGIGGTDACLRNLLIARRRDFDGVLASPPAYIKTPQRGLLTHFLRLATEEMPLCVYEVPGRACSSVAVETLQALVTSTNAAAKWVVATKDASGDMKRQAVQNEKLKGRVALLSGDDGTYANFCELGGDGCVSVVGHVLPKSMEFIRKQGGNAEAKAEQARINPFIDALFWEANPIPVKCLLAAQKKIQAPLFLPPLCEMDPTKLKNLLELAAQTPDHA